MFCHECGCKLSDDAQFCAQCGAKISQTTQNQAENTKTVKKRSGALPVILLVVVVAVLGIVIGTILGGGEKSLDKGQEDTPYGEQDQKETQAPDDGLVTIYCLTQRTLDARNRMDYQYDKDGNLIAARCTIAGVKEVWNESLESFEYIPQTLENGTVISDVSYSYDEKGNITEAHCVRYDDGSPEYEYTSSYAYSYGENGEIVSVAYTTTEFLVSPLNYYFTYQDGRIVNVDVYMATSEGETYGEMVTNYRFEYDDQGRLCGEHITHTESEYHALYTYDQQGQVTRVEYSENRYGDEKYRTCEFQYDSKKNTVSQYTFDENGDEDDTNLYYLNGQTLLIRGLDEESGIKLKYDDYGNVILATDKDDSGKCEYSYEMIRVTPEQAERYYRQQQMEQTNREGPYTDFYYPVFFYHLISNPVW